MNYAFISYSRKDIKWAVWLQHKLENCNIHNLVTKQQAKELPKFIRPVFRDKTDIGIGELEQGLSKELEDSRFLIVICSSSTANPNGWVNKEVSHFKQLNKEDKIIPLIIEGTPQPKDKSEFQCYPPELDKHMLGASLAELSKEEALIKIIAFILGIKFDKLWQRHKRREKRRKKIIITTFLIGLFAIVLFLFQFLKYLKEKEINLFLTDSDQKQLIGKDPNSIKRLDLSKLNDSLIPSSIKYFKNIDTLIIIQNNRVKDIGNISHLRKIRFLNITHTGPGLLQNLKGIENLNILETLVIHGNSIKDWEKISGLITIKKLTVVYANLKTLKPLRELKNIEELKLDPTDYPFSDPDTPQYELSEISKYHNLKKLYLSNSGIKSINELKNNEQLNTFDISNNMSITDFDSIVRFHNLVYLNISNTKFSKLGILTKLNTLSHLDVSGCEGISDWDNLSNLKKIETLNIGFSSFNESEKKKLFPNLKKLENLKKLFLDENLSFEFGGIDKIKEMLPSRVMVTLIDKTFAR